MGFNSYSQVNITTADLSNICVGGGYYGLGDITIAEDAIDDFSVGTDVFFRIDAPVNFEFKAVSGSPSFYSFTSNELNIDAITITASYVEIQYDVTATAAIDEFTIQNLQVRAISGASIENLSKGTPSGLEGVINFPASPTFGEFSSIEAPTVLVQPINTDVCEGDDATLSVTADGAILNYQWERNAGSGFEIIDGSLPDAADYANFNTPTLQINNASTAINGYDYRAVITGVCLPVETSNTINLTVNPTPPAPSVTNQNEEICLGETVTLPVASGGAGNFRWYNDANLTSFIIEKANPTAAEIGFDNSTAGTYTVYVTENSAQSCEGEATTVSLIVNPGVNSTTITTNTTPSSTSVCDSETLTFTLTNTGTTRKYQLLDNSNAPFSSEVLGNGGSLQITSDAFVRATYGADETIRVRETILSTGCTAILTSPSNVNTITINELPTVTLNSDDLDNTICNGSTIVFTAGGATNYQFFINGNPVQGPSIINTFTTSTLADGDLVSVTGTDGNSCSNSPVGITITVEDAPAAPTIISSSGSTVCDGSNPEVTLTSQAAPNGGAYQWYKNGTEISGETNQTINISDPAGSGNYSVAVTDGNNAAFCLSPQSANETVAINPLPNAGLTVTPNDPEVCNGNTITFSIAGSQNGVNYELFNASNASFSSPVGGNGGTIAISSIAFSTDETITVRATNASTGCSVDLTDTETITVNPLPTVTLNSDDLDNTICNGSTIVFTAGGATNYQFFINGNPVQGPSIINTFTTSALADGDLVSVTGTDGNSCSNSPVGITITVEDAPAAPTIISSSGSTVCDGSNPEVTLTSQAAPNGGAYQWYKNGTEISGETNQTINISDPAGSGNYSVAVTDGNNAAFCLSPQSANETVAINPLPNAGLTVTPNDPEVCNGNTITFSIAGSQNGVNYELFNASNASFSSPVGGNGGTIAISSIAFSTDETITVRATNASTGCSVDLTDTETITVNPLPTVTLNSDDLDNTICNGSTIVFTAGGATNYQFFINGNPVQGPSIINTFTTSALADGDLVSVTGTDGNSCSNSPVGITITVEDAPAAPTIISSSGSTVCDGSNPEVTLTSQAAPNGGAYQWYKNGTEISGETNQTINISDPAGSGNYSVAVTDGNNAAFCLSPQSANETVAINPLPNAGLTVTPNDPEVCNGNTITFSIAGSQNGVNYELFNASNASFSSPVGGNGGTIAISSIAFSTDETITVRATNASTGCSVDLTDTETITVNPLPTVTLNSDDLDNTICNGSTIVFTAGGATNYQFFINGNPVQGPSIINTFTTSALADGDLVSVTGTDGNSCSNSPVGITITVEDAPAAPTIISSSGSTVCDGSNPEVTLTSQAAPNGGAYQWYKNGTEISGETNQTINISDPAGSGNYSVAVTDGNNAAFCLSPQSANETVAINPLPNAGLTVTPNDPEVCNGNTITFSIAGSQNGVNYELFNASNASFSSPVGGNGGTIAISSIAFSTDETITVRATNASTGCSVDLTDTETITVNPLPTVTLNSDDLDNTICNGSTIVFTAGGATNYQFFINGNPVQGPSIINTFTTSALADGDLVSVTGTDGNSCSNSPVGITITVEDAPAAPTIISSSGSTVCDGSNPEVTLTSQAAPNGGAYQWYKNGTEISGETNQTINISDPAGSGNYSVAVTDGNNAAFCLSPQSANETVAINPLPNAGLTVTPNDPEVCNGNTITFSIAGSQNGVNYELFNASNASFSSPVGGNGGTIAISSIAFSTDETITVRATNASTGCNVDLTDTETITVNPLPTVANAGSDIEQCNNSNFTLTGNDPVNGTGLWTLESGTATIDSPSQFNSTVSNLSVGTSATLRWTISNSPCTTSFDEVTLTNTAEPSFSTAITNTEICSGDLIDLEFSTTEPSTITWTANNTSVGNPASGTDRLLFVAAPNNSGSDIITTITVQAINSACTSPITMIFDLILNTTPTIPAFFNPTEVCEDNNSFDLSSIVLNATPAGGTYSYSGNGVSGTTFDATDATVNTGIQEIEVTYTSLDGCVRIKDINLLEVIELPTANAGADDEVCVDTDFTVADAGATNDSGILWTVTTGGGALTDETTLTPTYSPVTADAGTTVTLTMTVSGNGSCDPAVDTKDIVITPAPTANAGADDEVCVDTDFTVADAAATNDSGILWTVTTGGGALTDETTLTPTYSPVTADAGTTVTLTMTVSGNGSCDPAVDTKDIVITPAPTANAGADDEVCVDTDFTVADASATNDSGILWTVTTGGGALTDETTLTPTYSPVTADAGTTVTLTMTVSGNGSCDPAVDTKDIVITPAPTANAGADDEVCVDTDFTVADAAATNDSGILWTVTTGGGTLTDETTLTPTYSPVTADAGTTVTLTMTVSGNGSCDPAVDTKDIVITPAPTANAGADDEVCVDTDFTVADAAATNDSGILWTVTTGGGALTDETTLTPTYSPVTADAGTTVTLTMTVSGNGSCDPAVDTKDIVITPAPTANAGADDEVCVDTDFTVADAAATNDSGILWTVTTGGGTLTDETTLTPTYSPVTADAGTTVTLTMTVSGNGSCDPAVDTKDIVITPAPTANAGADDEVCVDTDFTVADAAATNDSGILWTVTTGGGTLTDQTTLTPTYSPVTADAGTTVTLTMTVSGNGSCDPAVDTKDIVITPAPTANAGADDEVCVDTDFTVADAAATNDSGILWTVTTGGGTLTDQTTLTPTYSPVTADAGTTVTLTMTVSGNGSCDPAVDTKDIVITPAPTANAGADDEVCVDTDFTVADAAATNDSGILWTVTTGGGALTDETTLTPTYSPVTADAGTTVTLTMTVSGNGSCDPAVDTKDIVITPAPTANAGADDEVCVDTDFTVADASATNDSGILWTVTTGGGTLTDQTTLTPTYSPVTADAGTTVTLTMTVSGNGSCDPAVDTKDIVITPAPTANAGADDEVCVDTDFTVADAAATNDSGILWTVTTGGGTLTDETTLTPTYSPVTADAGTTVTLTMTVSGNGSCDPAVDTKDIVITPAPTANAGADDEVCVDTDFTVADAAATNDSGILWTVTTGGGTLTDETTLTPTYSPVTADAGTTVTLTMTVSGNGSCDPAVDTKDIVITPAPTANAGADDEVCVDTDFTVADASATNDSGILWTVTTGGGTLTDETTLTPTYSPVTADAGTTVTLTMTVSGNGSCDPAVDTKDIVITPAPTANAGADDEVCVDTDFTVADAAATNDSGILWTVTTGGGALTDETTLTPTYSPVTADAGTTVTLTMTVSGNGSCDPAVDTKDIVITPAPTANAGADDEVCVDTDFTVADAAATNDSGILWTVTTGGGALTDETTLTPTYSPVTADAGTTVTLTMTVSGNGSCDPAVDTKDIVITPAPTANAGADDEVCVDTDFTVADAGATNDSGILWTVTTGGGTLTDETTLTPTYSPVTADAGTTVTLTMTVSGNGSCDPAVDTKDLIINALPTANITTTATEVCEADPFTLSGTIGGGADTGEWRFNSSQSTQALNSGTLSSTTNNSGTWEAVFTPNSSHTGNNVIFEFVASGSLTCSVDVKDITLNIRSLPSTIDQSYFLCEDVAGDGLTNVDLTEYNDDVTVEPAANVTIEWYTNSTLTNMVIDETDENVSNGSSYYAKITFLSTTCFDVAKVDFAVNPLPLVNALTKAYCEDDFEDNQATVDLTFLNPEINNQAGNYSFEWFTSSDLSSANQITGIDLSNYIVTNALQLYVNVINDDTGCENNTTVDFQVLPEPDLDTPSDITVCSFENISTNFSTSNLTGVTYSWTNDNGATGIPLSGTGNINATVNENVTGADIVSNITVTATKDGCVGDIKSFIVTVNPKPVITTELSRQICSGDEILPIGFSDDSGGSSTITWTATNAAAIGLPASSGSGNTPAFTANTNNTTATIISNITVTSNWNGCVSDQMNFQIRLLPTPLINAVSDEVLCSGENYIVNFTNSLPTGTTYDWVNDNTNIGLAASGSGDISFTAPTNTTGTSIVANIIVTPFNNSCEGPQETFTLTLNPTPVFVPLPNVEYCSEEFVSIPISTDLTDVNLSLSVSDNSIFSTGPVLNAGNIEFTTAVNTSGADINSNIIVTAEKNSCQNSEVFEVKLKYRPVVSSESDLLDLCSGDLLPAINFSHDSGIGNFSWELTNSALIGDNTPASGAGNFPGFQLAENLTGSEIDGYIKYFSTNRGCISSTDSFKITLKPAPVVLNEDVVFYAGDQANVEFLSNTEEDTDFYWSNNQTSIGINNVQGNTENIENNTITPNGFIATNPFTSDDNIAVITVYGITNGCKGPDRQFRIIVKPNPVIEISYQNVCEIDNAVKLGFNTSFNDLESDSIVAYSWSVPDNPELEIQNDTVQFNSPGRKNVRLEVQTALNRTFTSNYTVEVWNVENINFTTTNVSTSTAGDSTGTKFSPTVQLDPSISNDIVELSYEWDFGDPTSGTRNVSSDREPIHNYETPGVYSVTLSVIAEGLSEGAIDSCVITQVNLINIVESVDVFPYIEDFEDGPAGWGSNPGSSIGSSWTYIQDNTANYFSNSKNNSRVWGTVLNERQAGFFRDENSYLQTPNFDFSGLDKPMIAFDMWLDVEDQNRAGAIIEYSTDDVNWQILGDIGDPLNWYNTNTLNAIGGEISNEDQIAWSYYQDEEWQWKRVAYPLDQLKTLESTIFFRINFKGNDNENSSGIAIDNFYVGERQKLVVLENFTNLNSVNYINNRSNLQNLRSSELNKDILPLNFHISIPSPDSVNLRNSVEMDARASLYSIEESPKIHIDGELFEEEIYLAGGELTNEVKNVITSRSLLEPTNLVDLKIDTSANTNSIRFSATLDPHADTTTLMAYFFIIEKSTTPASELNNIVRKILPSINGITLNDLSERTTMNFEWEVNSVYTNDDLAIVSIVQERNTNRIVEVKVNDIEEIKIPDNILSIEDGFNSIGISLYPNPSRGNVNLKFNRQLDSELKVIVFDTNGKIVKTTSILKGSIETELNLNGIASGVYHIITKTSEGQLNRQKVVILD